MSNEVKQRQVLTEKLNSAFLELQAFKRAHPETKLAHYRSHFGSLLNAYREGDLEFFDCVDLINGKLKEAVDAERERCAKIAEAAQQDEEYGHAAFRCVQIARAIREEPVP